MTSATILLKEIKTSTEFPHEAAWHHFYEVWQPLDEPTIYHIEDGQLFEPIDCAKTSIKILENPKYYLQWLPGGIKIPLEPIKDPNVHVYLMIRSYAKVLNEKGEEIFQHISDCAILFTDSGKDVTKKSIHNAECRFIGGEENVHETFVLDIEWTPNTISRKTKDWEQDMWIIYNQYIKKDVDRIYGYGANLEQYTLTPISFMVNGVPVKQSNDHNKDLYKYLKGLSHQAFWIIDNRQVIEEDFFLHSLTQCLQLRKLNLDQFNNICKHIFIKDTFTEIKIRKGFINNIISDVVRSIISIITTQPFQKDIRYERNGKINQMTDDFNRECARIVRRDCEDGAGYCYQLLGSLLKRKWTDPTVQWMRRIILLCGCPFGVSGMGKDPTTKLGDAKGVNHMFATIIPFKRMLALLTNGNKKVYMDHYLSLFGLPDKERLEKVIDILAERPVIIETTVLTTPFYHTRNHTSSSKKAEMAPQIRKALSWRGKGATAQIPLGDDENEGYIVHKTCYRFSSDLIETFIGTNKMNIFIGTDKIKELDITINRTFLIMSKGNRPGSDDFFSKTTHDGERFESTAESTEVVDKLERAILFQFQRPFSPIGKIKWRPWMDLTKLMEVKSPPLQKLTFYCHDPNRHLKRYVWIPTEKLIAAVKQDVTNNLQPHWFEYFNGYMVVFVGNGR
jgi:hypothetical protein